MERNLTRSDKIRLSKIADRTRTILSIVDKYVRRYSSRRFTYGEIVNILTRHLGYNPNRKIYLFQYAYTMAELNKISLALSKATYLCQHKQVFEFLKPTSQISIRGCA